MIKIQKEVAKKLNKEYKIPYKEGGISKTSSKHPTYYLCESEYNLCSLLNFSANDEAKKLLDEKRKRKRKTEEYRRY